MRRTALFLMFLASRAGATGICLSGASPNPGEGQYTFLFPNWQVAHLVTFDLWLCDTAVCTFGATETVTGLTIVNYGTAQGGTDLAALYWGINCGGSPNTGIIPMTYAGVWGGMPAWTWAGTSINLAGCAVAPDFSMPLRLYADVAACPTEGTTVTLGIRVDPVANPLLPGGMTDQYWVDGCVAPFDDVTDLFPKVITYASKSRDRDIAAPGDTVTYTVFYGRPGTTPVGITVLETLPPYTHWTGVATPAPDGGWNPDPGPPLRLRWSFPGPLATTGGPTGQITFAVTVDWGNGESFEPGSGDVGAPEGSRLTDSVDVFYAGSSCPSSGTTSNQASVVVRRYLYWMLGDNDILFAGRVGVPDDEMTYEITLRNQSPTKTWWNVSIWDTVPPELDVWSPGYGHDDPCTGWTLTPSGCAAASPGKVVAGAQTILTWDLDLPPAATVSLRWKARVRTSAPPASTAINRVAVMARGNPGVVGGTGHAGLPRTFVHAARIVLRTTYISYAAWAGDSAGNCDMFITFYPLNKATDFELRGLEYQAAPWVTAGGPSASIGTFIGTCLGGLGCAGSAGCKVERVPAFYPTWPLAGCAVNIAGNCPTRPFHFIYKLTANAPVLWILFTAARSDSQDAFAFTPSTSLTFSGLMHYTYVRTGISLADANDGDMLTLLNTSLDVDGIYDSALATTAIVFTWDPVALAWNYLRDVEIDADSQWTQGPATQETPEAHYRVVSSQSRLVIRESMNVVGGCGNQIANTAANLSPTRETGTLVSNALGNTFYVFPGSRNGADTIQLIVGNTGATTVTYRVEKYLPRDLTARTACVPLWLADTTGVWSFVNRDSVGPGLATVLNAHLHGRLYDASTLYSTADRTGGLWRLIQETAGNIQVESGSDVGAAHSGGTMLHAANGGLVGTDFWLFEGFNDFDNTCNSGGVLWAPDFFAPKSGMAVRAQSSDGYSATYTTNGPDQCVTFFALTSLTGSSKRNVHVSLLAGGTQGSLIAHLNHCITNHKFFAAPFLVNGVHYDIIAPPAVFIGQSFWITVIVASTGGGTQTDYCGTTSFTATDPAAKIENTGMDTYNYTWDSNDPGASCVGAGCTGGCDNGVKLFFNVTMTKLGPQTIIANDTIDGSITGLATVMVVGVDIRLTKTPPLAVSASGDTVQFRICWSAYSSASAFTFVITDAVPMGTVFVPEASTAGFDCGNTKGVAPRVAYSTAASVTPPAAFTEANPIAGTRWLRFTIPQIGVATTGCVCFKVTVN